MPKPLFGDNGSGMHTHQSLWKDGIPLMYDETGYAGLSDTARHYIGGLLHHAPSLLAFTNPTTNSYKRLVPGFEAPINLVYSQRNRSACVRIPITGTNPKAKRLEFRCPDSSGNPYLAFSAMLMAGLDGIKNKIEPHTPVDKDLYELPPEEAADIPQAPTKLSAVIDRLEEDHEYLTEGGVFTPDLIETWISYKRDYEIAPVNLRPTRTSSPSTTTYSELLARRRAYTVNPATAQRRVASGDSHSTRAQQLRPLTSRLGLLSPSRQSCLRPVRRTRRRQCRRTLTVDRGQRWRLALAQRRDQLAVRADEVDGVAGLQPGVAAGAQTYRPFRTSDRDDACLGGHLHHLQSVQLAALRYEHSADHERALPDPERPQHVQAHRGADEPWRRQRRRSNARFQNRTADSPRRPARGLERACTIGTLVSGPKISSSTIPVSMFTMSLGSPPPPRGRDRRAPIPASGAWPRRRRSPARRVRPRSTGTGCSRLAR